MTKIKKFFTFTKHGQIKNDEIRDYIVLLEHYLWQLSCFTRTIPMGITTEHPYLVCPECSSTWGLNDAERHADWCIIIKSRKLLEEKRFRHD